MMTFAGHNSPYTVVSSDKNYISLVPWNLRLILTQSILREL